MIPLALISGLSIEQMNAILAHELAHVRRHDYLVNLVQTAIETLFFHHPAVRWISVQIRAAREECCDDLAVAACGGRIVYARALVDLEERCRPVELPARMLAPAVTDGSLIRRIRRLLTEPKPPALLRNDRRVRGNLAALVVVVLVLLSIGMRFIWQSTSQTARAEEPATLPASQPEGQEILRAGDTISISVLDLMGQAQAKPWSNARSRIPERSVYPFLDRCRRRG